MEANNLPRGHPRSAEFIILFSTLPHFSRIIIIQATEPIPNMGIT